MMPTAKHVKSVSFGADDVYHSAPSFGTISESGSQKSSSSDGFYIESIEADGHAATMQAIGLDPWRVYGLREDSDASDDSFVIDEFDQLFRVRDGQWDALAKESPTLEADDEKSNGSTKKELAGPVSDTTVDDDCPQYRIPLVAPSGDHSYHKITAHEMIKDISSKVNINSFQVDLTEEDGKTHDVLSEHAQLVLSICSTLNAHDSHLKLKHELHYDLDIPSGAIYKSPKCAALELYNPSNMNFDTLENAWHAWHKRIQYLQINLTSIINTRVILMEAEEKLIVSKAKAAEEHEQWQPDPVPVKSPHKNAHFVVDTTYSAETGKHEVPESLIKFNKAHDILLVSKVNERNAEWEQLEKNFANVMIPLRYAQTKFRNLQLKFENVLALDIMMLQKAMAAHEGLEIAWSDAILGLSDETDEHEDLASSGSIELEQPIESPASIPTMSRMQRWMKVATSDTSIHFEEFSSGSRPPRFAPDFSFSLKSMNENRSPRSYSVGRSPSSRSSSASLRDRSRRASIDTAMTTIDEGPVNLKPNTTATYTSKGLYTHPSQAQRRRSTEAMSSAQTAHEKLVEIMKKHEATIIVEALTLDGNEQNTVEERASEKKSLEKILARHEAERIAREELYTANSERLHEFGLIDFENIRRIHRDIMNSAVSNTDKRCRLGLLINHFQECQLCWCDAGSRPCCRCERLSLGYHFGVGRQGYWVGTRDGKRVIDDIEEVDACEYLGRRYCVASGNCDLCCKSLASKLGLDMGTADGEMKEKGKGRVSEQEA